MHLLREEIGLPHKIILLLKMMRNLLLKIGCFIFAIFALGAQSADASTLKLNPGTGVYTVGNIFSLSVLVNTDGKSINAADGEISFNPRELQVVSVSRASSIFNLWTEEPKYSNTAGTVSFSGGSPTGYKGASGNITNITFKSLAAGTPKITFKTGSILAADGLGTNILTGMSGGTYTVSAKTENPEPEYIAPANTPKAPSVTSESHPDTEKWYTQKIATLTWSLPADVTSVRMLLDEHQSTIPTNVYDERITTKTIEDLDEGVSYFHIQFKNAEGWGKAAHYPLRVDTQTPEALKVSNEEAAEGEVGTVLTFSYEDISLVREFKIQFDGGEPAVFLDEKDTKRYLLGVLSPGYHTVVVEAIDAAGNSSIASHSFTVESFEKPIFTDVPVRISDDVIPALKGTTRPDAKVTIVVRKAEDAEASSGVLFEVVTSSNKDGAFVFIPDNSFEVGVYEITAQAVDSKGRSSELSDPVRIIVEISGYIAAGETAINILSVVVPLIALILLSVLGTWYSWFRFTKWRKKIRKETTEVEDSLAFEFGMIVKNLNTKVDELHASRKGKLTKNETALIEQIKSDIKAAKERITKEVEDIEDIIK
jgi:hypothetical protein